ncbi:hemolysin family protein [Segeticoccus rhizosphaerae]|uniref:hemolysin family protein n=1 Tax=Segeticoccus rhizosphaerae TaxID=1104777 RepID=UPI0012645495|nr:hemolysin family protein [Segeticoccus rhizosphaerae]
MNLAVALLVSLGLLVANAFFVAAEFALVASRTHRLERLAADGGRAARAAYEGSRELSLMLAGAQLGITICTLGLGALAKPALATLLDPAFRALGLPVQLGGVVAIVLAVVVVVFLHMVIGEMAPKSWAISHPERSALLLALPFRGFTRAVRPALRLFNALANVLVRAVGVSPRDTVDRAHAPAQLHLLFAQSHEHGALPDHEHRFLSGALWLEQKTLGALMRPIADAVTIAASASSLDVERVSRDTGRSRLIVLEDGTPQGLVHVRDAVQRNGGGTPCTVSELRQGLLVLPADLPLIDAVTRMREQHAQLTLVARDGAIAGLAALEDLLEEVLGQFEDETDPSGSG